ncbi:MAG: M23 family metallopeptidase [Hyphomicrobium zavarzinii]|uniref:M23 family metallopeptidase n=1 Tax=Hyphomicrobium zavarzinii TaxID=48292 RepID=UPI00036DAD21|nr:M23 family metallopeptidase [Hyphomicrobium zavarzinii]MBL8845557.1 M23 family metallopeptidase [Hyphomicrobium zavarzinii]
MIDHRRHAPIARCRPVSERNTARKAPLHRGAKTRRLRDMYGSDHAEPMREGRFRWLMSTCLAAAVGGVSILVVIFGSADKQEAQDGLMPALARLRESTAAPPLEALLRRDDGLKWAVPKVDRLQVTSGAKSTRFIIHETLRQRRGGREYIYAKPYVRLVARLAPVPPNAAETIPPFNPFKLYANNKPIGEDEDGARPQTAEQTDVSIRVVELLGGVLPLEDGQSIDNDEAGEIVERFEGSETVTAGSSIPGSGPGEIAPEETLGQEMASKAADEPAAPNTTVLTKTGQDDEGGSSDVDALKPTVKTVREGQKLSQLLAEAGATSWQVREMIEAMKPVFPEKSVLPGQEVHIALQPSLTQLNRMEPVRFSVYDEGHAHKVTVTRNSSGEFVASATPMDSEQLVRLAMTDSGAPQTSSLYASLYHASLIESVPTETIQQILRVHAYETDFRRRLRAGDTCEMFFDLKDEGGTDGPPGELLYTSITTGGEMRRYYRFRTPDGQVDYYDAQGSNAKKFLNRRPVRGDDIRLTSGFGLRRHPLLGEYKMHTGIDWAAPTGTPILAAGNGTIEEAGRKGYNGNYVRIRHANGYQTAYSHMSRFAPGAAAGVKVRQGQVIGYIGTTGLSSGPHLHFEILVNNQFVNPLSIEVPRERQLEGKDLIAFHKERMRIDELMRRAPVLTASK